MWRKHTSIRLDHKRIVHGADTVVSHLVARDLPVHAIRVLVPFTRVHLRLSLWLLPGRLWRRQSSRSRRGRRRALFFVTGVLRRGGAGFGLLVHVLFPFRDDLLRELRNGLIWIQAELIDRHTNFSFLGDTVSTVNTRSKKNNQKAPIPKSNSAFPRPNSAVTHIPQEPYSHSRQNAVEGIVILSTAAPWPQPPFSTNPEYPATSVQAVSP